MITPDRLLVIKKIDYAVCHFAETLLSFFVNFRTAWTAALI